jgi:hypothetical protein
MNWFFLFFRSDHTIQILLLVLPIVPRRRPRPPVPVTTVEYSILGDEETKFNGARASSKIKVKGYREESVQSTTEKEERPKGNRNPAFNQNDSTNTKIVLFFVDRRPRLYQQWRERKRAELRHRHGSGHGAVHLHSVFHLRLISSATQGK